MLNNRNHFSKKKKYRHVRHNFDLSNNNPFTSNTININNNHQKDDLQLSNAKNIFKMFNFNDDIVDANDINLFINNKHNTKLCISNKNNLNPFIDCNTMNIIPINPPIKTNKLITCLDNNGSNNGNDNDTNKCNDKTGNKTDTIKIDREKTDILLKFLLKSTEKEFYEKYNSPFFPVFREFHYKSNRNSPPLMKT